VSRDEIILIDFILFFYVVSLFTFPIADRPVLRNGNHHGEKRHEDMHKGGGHVHVEVPPEYADKYAPEGIWTDPEVLTKGKEIYDKYCLVCHGAEGKGDGTAAQSLDPKPSDMTDRSMVDEMADNFWFWRVSEGGAVEPYKSMGSTMPAWKDKLNEDEIWAVIVYQHTFSGHKGPHIAEEHPELRN